MTVRELSRRLCLPDGSTHADCMAKVERLTAAKSRRDSDVATARLEAKFDNAGRSSNAVRAKTIRALSDRGMSPRAIGAVLAAEQANVDDALGFAEEITPDHFRLGDIHVNGAQLEALMRARAEAEYAARAAERESEVVVSTLEGEALHKRAMALLASRQVFDPSHDELLSAYTEVGAE